MADDERPDQQVAQWLEVEPLDDVTRRRLVSTALHQSESESGQSDAAEPARSARAWQWLTAAAVLVVVLVVGLALLTAGGGNDEEQATRNQGAVVAPKSATPARDVGDYGDLDDPANLGALRSALETSTTESGSAPQAASDAAGSQFGSTADAQTSGSEKALRLCGVVAPDGGSVVAQGTGTFDGRRATVVLVEDADGSRTFEAVLEDPCEVRPLP